MVAESSTVCSLAHALRLTHTPCYILQFCSESGLRRAYHVVSDLGLSCDEYRRYGPALQGLELIPYNAGMRGLFCGLVGDQAEGSLYMAGLS